MEEALYIIHKCYEALGMVELSNDAKRVLESTYPGSDFLSVGGKKESDSWLDMGKLNPSKIDWSFTNFDWLKAK